MSREDEKFLIRFDRWKDLEMSFEELQEDFDIQFNSDQSINILYDNKHDHVQLVMTDIDNKEFEIRVNQNTFKLKIHGPLDLLMERLNFNQKDKSKAKRIIAPMPGLILEVLVEEGQDIADKEPLCIIEAMKMQNVMQAPAGKSTIKKIHIQPGLKVEKNQLMIELK